MQTFIEAGDIIRKEWPIQNEQQVNIYSGSGRCGASFDKYGLMNNGYNGHSLESIGKTFLMHADHYHRGDYGLDYYLPLARLVWGELPPQQDPDTYEQMLSLYNNRLRTAISWPELSIELNSYFHAELRDVLAVEIAYDATTSTNMPSLLLAAELDLKIHYDQLLEGNMEKGQWLNSEKFWSGSIVAGTARTSLIVKVLSIEGEVSLTEQTNGMAIDFTGISGKHLLLIAACNPTRENELIKQLESIQDMQQYAEQASDAWHKRLGDSYIDVHIKEYQAIWARSLYYALCSYAPDVRSPAPVNGWSGNGWPFTFPQDLSYILPALLRLGHTDIAQAWIEFFAKSIDHMEAYTSEVYGAEGTMWAWVSPIGENSKLLRNGAPNRFHYQIHNPAYVVRMTWETAQMLGDADWSRRVAWPVVQGAARFYASILYQEENETWGVHVIPSMGQDENGEQDERNYLCSLYAAQYSFQVALEMAERYGIQEKELAEWRSILQDGLAYHKLLDSEKGLYRTSDSELHGEMWGKQKHPVQIIPLTFMPLKLRDAPVQQAYQARNLLCKDALDKHYYGWTLAAFWVAAAHMGDSDSLVQELENMIPGGYTDEARIQFYESTGSLAMPYYITTHGLFLQALNDALVDDYWGETRYGAACPQEWEQASFHRMHLLNGQVVSGHRLNGEWVVTLE